MTLKKKDRLRRLSEAIRQHQSLHIRDAAELLDVSEMTVRRDIKEAPELFNFYGGHIVPFDGTSSLAPYDLSNESEVNSDAKRAACQAALPYVKPKETIFVDCGTTLAHLVNILPLELEITLVCYSLNIADLAVRRPNVTLILLGGTYHTATASFYPLDQDYSLGSLAINAAFLSAAGIDEKLGATCMTFREARLKRAAMERASQSILIADEKKLGVVKKACFAQLDDFDLVLTENGPLSLTQS